MGLRGKGANPLHKRQFIALNAAQEAERQQLTGIGPVFTPLEVPAWTAPELTRSERVIRFCEGLRITSGTDAGGLMVLRPWQREFIEAVYAVNTDGLRLVRTAMLSMGRKNGKTQLAAMLALAHLLGPEAESRGEVYSCANDRFQAAKIFAEMVALIAGNPEMLDRVNIVRFKKEIEDLKSGSFYAALTAEAKTKMGLNPSFIVYDELGQAADRHLYDAMDCAMGAQKRALAFGHQHAGRG